MSVEWRDVPARELEELVSRLIRIREIRDDGVGFGSDPFFEDVLGILASALSLPDAVPEREARYLVGRALFDRSGFADAEGFRRRVEERADEFLSATPLPYVLVGAVSAKHFEGLEETDVYGCRLSFHPYPPEPFRDGYLQAERRARPNVNGEMPGSSAAGARYTYVVAHADGRTETEAAGEARAALDLQRGLWNLFLRRYAHAPPASSPPNHVQPGPVQSLHRPNGRVLLWPLWYEPEYCGPVGMLQSQKLERHWGDVREDEETAREGLSKSHYRSEVEDFVRDYALALDGRDPEAAFVRLWGLLERATGQGLVDPRESHAKVTRRAVFLIRAEFRGLQYQLLENLRRHRNAGVHDGLFPGDVRRLLGRLRSRVATVLEFHLENRFGLSSMEEAARFFDQPSESGPLLQRLEDMRRQGRAEDERLAKMAMKYHGHAG